MILPAQPRLVFVETAEHARAALARRTDLRIDAVVALDAEAAWTLSQAKAPYLTLEHGYDPRTLCELADPIVEQQQEWATTVDRWLQQRVQAFEQHQFQPTRLYLYWLKVLFDSLSIRVYPIRWAFEEWKPSWIWHPGPTIADGAFGWDLTFRQSLYVAALREVAGALAIEADLPNTPPGETSDASVSGVPHWMRRGRVVNVLASVQDRIRRVARRPAFARRGADAAWIVAADRYDLASVSQAARSARVAIDEWAPFVERHRARAAIGSEEVRNVMRQLWPEARKAAGLLAPAVIGPCDLGAVAEARLKFWWEALIPEQWGAYLSVRLAPTVPDVAAVSGLGDHVERGVFGALRSRGSRTYMYQHGGFVGACECPPWDCNDLWLADLELSYGAGTSAYFAERGRRYSAGRAIPLTVGSARLDTWAPRMRRRRIARRPQVVLVANVLPRNSRIFDAGTTPDVLESEIQVALVQTAAEYPGIDFTFKAFPQGDTPASRLAARRGSNCRLQTRGALTNLLARADLIVLSFASTALLEALLTNARILVLVDPRFVRMRVDACHALERRAHVAGSPPELFKIFRRLLAEPLRPKLTDVDDSFLCRYGTHLNDGHSAERALDAIRLPPELRLQDRAESYLGRAQ